MSSCVEGQENKVGRVMTEWGRVVSSCVEGQENKVGRAMTDRVELC